MNMQKELPVSELFDVAFFSGSRADLLNFMRETLEEKPQVKGPLVVFTPNPEQMVLRVENDQFRSDLSKADIFLPDGAGVVWAINRRQTTAHRLQRIPGREVFHELLEFAAAKNLKVFLLGGKSGSAEAVIAKYQREWQYEDGPKESEQKILEKIAKYKPDLLFVAYGAPYQERWVATHKEDLEKAGVRLAMVVGGAFEYESGRTPQVSKLIQNLHLEWLQRLILEPWRWKRQLKGAKFFWWVITGKDRTN